MASETFPLEPGSTPAAPPSLPLSVANGGTGSATGDASSLINLPAAQLTGNAPLASIATALAAGGGAIGGTVITANTRVESPTIGTSSVAQHALPSGTADVLTADSTATVTNKSIDAGQLTGSIANARLPAGTQYAVNLTSDAQAQIDSKLAASSAKLLPTPSGAGKVPYDDGSAYVAAAAGASTDVFHGGTAPGFAALSLPMLPSPVVTKLTAGSGTWTKASGARLVKVQVAGGASGGGSGRQGTAAASAGGSGGAGGGYCEFTFLASDLPATVSYTVGAGGAGGAAQASGGADGNPGIAGGASNFGTYLYARGGGAGIAGASTGTGVNTTGGASQFAGGSGGGGAANSSGGNATSSASGGAGSGGGGGGGPSVANFNAGGIGGTFYQFLAATTGGTGGATAGAAGAAGASPVAGMIFGSGGGGGASGDQTGATAGGAGGNGGTGCAGGGGGGSVTGAASGKGGNGGDGAIWITEW